MSALRTAVLTTILAGGLLAPTAPAPVPAVGGGGPVPDPVAARVARVETTLGPGRTAICTGTVVAPRLVLTAAHCLRRDAPADVTGLSVLAAAGTEAEVRRPVVAARPWTAGSGADLDRSTADLAVLELSAPASSSAAAPATTTARAGTAAVEVGYGAADAGGRSSPTARGGDRVVLGATSVPVPPPTSAGSLLLTAPVARARCEDGDSGGPLLAADGRSVLGVLSVGEPDGGLCWFTRVDPVSPARAWLDGQIAGSLAADAAREASRRAAERDALLARRAAARTGLGPVDRTVAGDLVVDAAAPAPVDPAPSPTPSDVPPPPLPAPPVLLPGPLTR